MTLDSIVRRNSLRFPAKPAIIMAGSSLTWLQLDRRIDRLVGVFSRASLERGDRVAILLDNCPEFFEIYFACARAGLIAVPLNYKLTTDDLRGLLAHSRPRAFVYGGSYQQAATELLRENDEIAITLEVGDSSSSFETAVSAEGESPIAGAGSDCDTVAIFYTSGTTGLPKGAMVSHRNLIANGFNQAIADGSSRDDINLVATPIYHMGAVFMAVTYMMLGCTQVILPVFRPDDWLRVAEAQRISVSLLIPTMINAVLNDPALSTASLDTLRLVFYGGGPMHPTVLRRAIENLGCGFTQGYGLTETLEATFLTADDHVTSDDPQVMQRLASAGREAIGADIRIVDDNSNDVGPGDVGEILIRSESVIDGYWEQPDETARAIRDGWFYTGDLGFMDSDRYLFVVDRKKDMIISGGVNIYTKEVEERLYQHPAVLEAAVIGLPDEHWGEMVTAVVVVRQDHEVTDDELIEHCRSGLASFKKPRRVEFVTELPKNPSGKILKRTLRENLAAVGP